VCKPHRPRKHRLRGRNEDDAVNPATLITIAMALAITARLAGLAWGVERWMPEESLLKVGDEQGGVRIRGTGSLPPAPPPGGAPPTVGSGGGGGGGGGRGRRGDGGGGGWSWVVLAIVIVGAAALYVVWRVL